jgi:DNA-binding transcriptional LysR family regulator
VHLSQKAGQLVQELLDIHRLQAFVTVIEEGSLSAAVGKLHITQPALSARLKLLEESLGCALLERSGRGVCPTAMGKLVYSIALDILARMHELHTAVRNRLELRDGFVHLGGGATAVTGVFPDVIHHFCQKHPGVQFTLQEKDSKGVEQAIIDGAVDIGIITRNPLTSKEDIHHQGLTVHAEFHDELVVIASLENCLSRGRVENESSEKSIQPQQLNNQPMILFEEGSAIRTLIDLEFRRLKIQPQIVMTLRSTQSMVRMVEKNIGLSIVSQLAMSQSKAEVKIVLIEGLQMSRRLAVVSSAERTLPPAAQEFLQVLLASWQGNF